MKTKITIAVAICFLFSVHLNAQVMTTIAGTLHTAGDSGDGGPATAAEIGAVELAVDKSGNVYFADQRDNCIRKISSSDTIIRFAGNGICSPFVGNLPATEATLCSPTGIAVDNKGNLYVSDFGNYQVRRVNTSGFISTVAGNGVIGHTGDGGAAMSAEILVPEFVAVDCIGNIYFYDGYIRRVDTSGIISTVAGNGVFGDNGDGGPATAAELSTVGGLAVDCLGNIYFSAPNRIRKVDTMGIISVFAGGTPGFGGDGGPATAAFLNDASAIAADSAGNIYICDIGNNVIRKVNTSGIITTVAGTDTVAGYDGDGFAATNAELNNPAAIAIGPNGNIYISDWNNALLREVILNETPSGISQIKSKDFVVFPNPTKDYLHVNNVLSVASYRILSIMGSALIYGTLNTGNNTIILSALPTGIYFLEIEGADGRKTVRKILKQ